VKTTFQKIVSYSIVSLAVLFIANVGHLIEFQPVSAQTQILGPYGQIPILTANVAADTATLAPFQMTGILTGTPTAAATYTTPTATALCALFPFVQTQAASNFWWDLYIKNTSAGAFTITPAGGSGVTLVGTGTASQNQLRHFKVVLNECRVGATAAAQLISLETSAF